jgi:hypothetical protein
VDAANKYYSQMVATFKYSFECCGVFPTLSLKLPQLQMAEAPKMFAEFSSDKGDDLDEIT